MVKFLLWLSLLILCWPPALILYPFVWLLMLPLRLIGVTTSGVFALLKSLLTLPASRPIAALARSPVRV